MSSTKADSYEGPKLICEAWHGARSPGFQQFKRNIKAGTLEYYLQDHELAGCLLGQTHTSPMPVPWASALTLGRRRGPAPIVYLHAPSNVVWTVLRRQ